MKTASKYPALLLLPLFLACAGPGQSASKAKAMSRMEQRRADREARKREWEESRQSEREAREKKRAAAEEERRAEKEAAKQQFEQDRPFMVAAALARLGSTPVDARKLWDTYLARSERGEFETTEAYVQRIAEVTNMGLLAFERSIYPGGGSTKESRTARTSPRAQAGMWYDIDAGVMEVVLPIAVREEVVSSDGEVFLPIALNDLLSRTTPKGQGAQRHGLVEVARLSDLSELYDAQNGYGAKMVAVDVDEFRFAVRDRDFERFAGFNGLAVDDGRVSFKLPMGVEEAKKLKASGGVLRIEAAIGSVSTAAGRLTPKSADIPGAGGIKVGRWHSFAGAVQGEIESIILSDGEDVVATFVRP